MGAAELAKRPPGVQKSIVRAHAVLTDRCRNFALHPSKAQTRPHGLVRAPTIARPAALSSRLNWTCSFHEFQPERG
jgi:hypothetical protein